MTVKPNWASRPHCPPGSDQAQNIHKAVASGFVLPKPERKVKVDLGDGGPGPTKTPGWFSTKK